MKLACHDLLGVLRFGTSSWRNPFDNCTKAFGLSIRCHVSHMLHVSIKSTLILASAKQQQQHRVSSAALALKVSAGGTEVVARRGDWHSATYSHNQ